MSKYIAIYLDCCLSDYFQGFDGPVLNVPVDNKSTYGELCGDLLRELQVYDSGYYEAGLGEPFDWEAAENAIIQLFSGVGVAQKVEEARYAEPSEDSDSCYFYIGLRLNE